MIIIGPSVFFLSCIVDDPVFFRSSSHTSASAAFKSPKDFSFLRNHRCYTFPVISSTSFSHIWIFWIHYNSFRISIKFILSKIKSQDHYVHQKLQMLELLILGLFSSHARLLGAGIKAVHCLSFMKFTRHLLPSISVIVFRHEKVSLWHVIGTSPRKVGDRITAPECSNGGAPCSGHKIATLNMECLPIGNNINTG